MENNQVMGILLLLIGLIFIIFPIFSLSLVSVFIGIVMFLISLGLIISGLSRMGELTSLSLVNILIGFIGAILGIIFMFNVGAISLLTALQFYIIGFVLIFLAITGYFGNLRLISTTQSAIIGVIGIALILIGTVTSNPLYLAIIVGICFLAQGVQSFLR